MERSTTIPILVSATGRRIPRKLLFDPLPVEPTEPLLSWRFRALSIHTLGHYWVIVNYYHDDTKGLPKAIEAISLLSFSEACPRFLSRHVKT